METGCYWGPFAEGISGEEQLSYSLRFRQVFSQELIERKRRGGIVLGVPLVLYKGARNNSSYLYYVVKGPSVNCTCVPA